VLPHGTVEALQPGLWAVVSSLPRGSMDRRMSIVRLSDGRLLFHNAVPLEEGAMRALEAQGEPAFLFVPSGFHRLDIHAWKVRYPRCRVLAPPGAAAAVARVVPVDGGPELLGPDPALEVQLLDGTRGREAAVLARGGGETSLLFGDAVMNIPAGPGLEGLLLRLLGSSGGPRVTRIARFVLVADRAALAGHLRRLAALPDLRRLVPSHGDIVAEHASDVLGQIAARLAR
jgi:hypothetical protein